jgi:2-keto-myo-inositol isomerase
MKLALSGATIPRSSLSEDIEIAAECGFTALEIQAGKLAPYLRDRSLDELRRKLMALGIAPASISRIGDITYRDAVGRACLVGEVARLAAVARAIGAPVLVVSPGRRADGFSRRESVAEAADTLHALAEAAGDVALAFEFSGTARSSVSTLGMALEVVACVDRPNVGLALDLFHFHAGGSRLEDVARVPVEKLHLVHLNGCAAVPRQDLTDAHAAYPGEGPIPAALILGRLRDRGYDGVMSVEVRRPGAGGESSRQVAQATFGAASRLLSNVGYR